MPDRTRRLVLTFGALATTVMIVLLTLNLVDIERQRRIAARQEERIQSLAGRHGADLGDLRRQLGAEARKLGRRAAPVEDGLMRADRLVRALLSARSPQAIARLAREAPPDLQTLVDLTGQLRDISDRIAGIADGTRQDVQATRSDVEATRSDLEQSLTIQRRTLAVLRQSLAIQRQTLEHTRRIDERTGGALVPTTR